MFHDRAGHLSEPILRESARQRGIALTGRMELCTTCIPARGTRADVPKSNGGRAGKAPGDLLHIDMCGPYTTTIGGNHYMFYAVDAARGYIANYALRRKSDAVAVLRRFIVDLSHKSGTRIRRVRSDCDSLWAESVKDSAQKPKKAASPSNPGRASPKELFTGMKGAFFVVPFFQYGFMYRERKSKLNDNAVPHYFLNADDNMSTAV